MKSPAFAITAALFLPLAGTAHAERFSAVDGTKLVNICTARDKGVVNDCTAYIEGISDTASFYQRVPPGGWHQGRGPAGLCLRADRDHRRAVARSGRRLRPGEPEHLDLASLGRRHAGVA